MSQTNCSDFDEVMRINGTEHTHFFSIACDFVDCYKQYVI